MNVHPPLRGCTFFNTKKRLPPAPPKLPSAPKLLNKPPEFDRNGLSDMNRGRFQWADNRSYTL